MANFNSSDPAPYVIDTSVAINLEASGIALELFKLFARPIFIVDVVPGELGGGRGYGHKVRQAITEWESSKLVVISRLSDEANATFESLISGSSTATIDDGEAATIAHALDIGAIAIIDEAKARRISGERFPALGIASTADLLLSPIALSSLGKNALGDAVFNALSRARMRVPADRQQEIVQLIGSERALLCSSLPASARRGE